MARLSKNGKKVGRPLGRGTLRTPENADRICAMLEEGYSLRQIAKELGQKSEAEIVRWGNGTDREAQRDEAFVQRYARAMVARWECMAEEVIEIADQSPPLDALGHVDTGWVQQARLRSDNRKWLLSKALPKRYGDRVEATITGDPSAPLLTRIELVAVPSPNAIEPPTIDHDDD
jgi:hypothetical protein